MLYSRLHVVKLSPQPPHDATYVMYECVLIPDKCSDEVLLMAMSFLAFSGGIILVSLVNTDTDDAVSILKCAQTLTERQTPERTAVA